MPSATLSGTGMERGVSSIPGAMGGLDCFLPVSDRPRRAHATAASSILIDSPRQWRASVPSPMQTFSFTVLVLTLALGLLTGWPIAGAAHGAAYAQSPPADSTALGRVEDAFRSGSPDALLAGAADRLDIIIFGKGASYSRAQAALVLTDFFRRNPPGRVMFEQEVLAEDRRSMIGEYWVAEDHAEPISVFVRLHARGARWQLRSIRIERSDGRR